MLLRILACVTGIFMRLRHQPEKQQPFEWVTCGRGGRFSRRDIDQASRLIEDDDVARYAGGQRSVWLFDESDLVDASKGKAVRWVEGRGWVEESR